jgi:protein-tyrosine-phosphatase
MNRNPLASSLVVLAAGLTACGSSGSSGLSRSAIDKQASSICAKASKDLAAVKQPRNIQDATAAAAFFDKVAPIADQQMKDLKALKPSKAVAADWKDFITKADSATGLLDTIRRKADAKDASGLNDLQKVGSASAIVDAAATKVGATACAK